RRDAAAAVRAAVAGGTGAAAGAAPAPRAGDRGRRGGGAGLALAARKPARGQPAASAAPGSGAGGRGVAGGGGRRRVVGGHRGVLRGPGRAGSAYPRRAGGDGRLQRADPTARLPPLATRLAGAPRGPAARGRAESSIGRLLLHAQGSRVPCGAHCSTRCSSTVTARSCTTSRTTGTRPRYGRERAPPPPWTGCGARV